MVLDLVTDINGVCLNVGRSKEILEWAMCMLIMIDMPARVVKSF